jgi:predicted HTH transcriptional regulator
MTTTELLSTKDQIDSLVAAGMSESRTLDFKETWWEADEKGNRDICVDIAALANAGGGQILIGIKEIEGIAVSVSPVNKADVDKQVCRITATLNARIAPRLPAPTFRSVPYGNGHLVVVNVTK